MRLSIFIVSLVALSIAGSAFALQVLQSAKDNSSLCAAAPASSTLIADWPVRYGSIANLTSASDAIIVGEVMAATPYVGGRSCELIFTQFTVSVQTSVRGSGLANQVFVVQTGGEVGTVRQEVMNDPLIHVGDRAVLFLHLDNTTGRFGVLGGPQGRFPVVQGLVYSLNVLYPERSINLSWSISGVPEASFTSSLH